MQLTFLKFLLYNFSLKCCLPWKFLHFFIHIFVIIKFFPLVLTQNVNSRSCVYYSTSQRIEINWSSLQSCGEAFRQNITKCTCRCSMLDVNSHSPINRCVGNEKIKARRAYDNQDSLEKKTSRRTTENKFINKILADNYQLNNFPLA